MNVRIEDLASWGPAKRVDTRQGPRMLRKASPSGKFWEVWREAKEQLKAAGISVSQRNGDWEICWWAMLGEAELAKVDAALEASRATDADVDLPRPAGLDYLPYQKAGIVYATARQDTLIADDMGLGKTIQAIGVWNCDPSLQKMLVICPASLRLNWQREIEKWSVRPVRVAIVNGGKPTDWQVGGANVVVINYDVVGKHRARIDQHKWDLLVIDEAHYLKNPKALRTKAILGKRNRGQLEQQPIAAKRRLLLTGTPIVNRPIELWPLVEAIDHDGLGKYFMSYAQKYCAAKQTRWGWDFKGASNLDQLQLQLRERCMVRRLKSEVLKELPPKRRQVIVLPANGASEAVAEERRIFDSHREYIAELEEAVNRLESWQELELEYDEVELQAMRASLRRAKQQAFTELSRVRHEVALAKVPAVVEHLEAAIECGPVVCFGHHKDVIAALAAAFPGRCVQITGDTPMAARQQAVDDFQTGKVPLFLGNIQAAGVGITLTASAHVVFAELDWVPGNLSQAEDRCHRIGQAECVLVQHIVLEASVDELMAMKIVAKQEVIDRALDRAVARPEAAAGQVDEIEWNPQPKPKAVEVEYTAEQRAAMLVCLRWLAGVCDGAMAKDDVGYNGCDSKFGKRLAMLEELSQRQAAAAYRMLPKYHRQLPAAELGLFWQPKK